jgi:hypothetical protein
MLGPLTCLQFISRLFSEQSGWWGQWHVLIHLACLNPLTFATRGVGQPAIHPNSDMVLPSIQHVIADVWPEMALLSLEMPTCGLGLSGEGKSGVKR